MVLVPLSPFINFKVLGIAHRARKEADTRALGLECLAILAKQVRGNLIEVDNQIGCFAGPLTDEFPKFRHLLELVGVLNLGCLLLYQLQQPAETRA